MHSPDETIVAIASPLGGAARGIVRLSGPNLRGCLEHCFRPGGMEQGAGGREQAVFSLLPAPCSLLPTVVPGVLWLAGFASAAPCELYLWPGGRSYTGQPVAEVHTLGSPPLLEAVVRAMCRGGARPAEPGEFTLRAFLAGRIDLTQAEAVLGVIDAAGAAELDAALKQLAGGLAAPLRRLRNGLLELLAHLEAGFDFADEDLPFITAEELLGQLQAASAQVDELAKKLAFRGESPRALRVVLVGLPNAGKSSLFNALAGRQGAIVSDLPGTTRDYLTAELDLDGVKCELIDTAGIDDRPGDCPDFRAHGASACGLGGRENGTVPFAGAAAVDLAAQQMTQEQSLAAHVRIVCVEAGGEPEASASGSSGGRQESHDSDIQPQQIVVLTKCDLQARAPRTGGRPDVLATSAVAGIGIGDLKAAIRAAALRVSGPQGEVVAGTAVRCGESLRLAAASLDRARGAISAGLGEELIATEVRVALNELGKVAGAVYTEDVLDRIFSRFCVGK
jgi:tRNA modification GTPase